MVIYMACFLVQGRSDLQRGGGGVNYLFGINFLHAARGLPNIIQPVDRF